MIYFLPVEGDPTPIDFKGIPSRDEIAEFLGSGNVEHVTVWPNRKRQSLFKLGAVINQPFNLWATLLYHECAKYQRGLKGSKDEPYVDSLEALAACNPLPDIPFIYGDAVWVNGVYVDE